VCSGTYHPRMVDHGNSELSAPVQDAHLRQKVLNESWPFRDSAGAHARGLDDRPMAEQLDVRVRVEFDRDGEAWLEGKATRWNRSHVCVVCVDKRLTSPYLWVRAHDVRRR
jgi:hypothetical protein